MRVLSIGTDRKLFEEGSAVRARVIEYGALFEELHVVVFASWFLGLKKRQIASNVWIYPTNSLSRWFYVFGAIRVGRSIVRGQSRPNVSESVQYGRVSKAKDWVVDSQDPFECGLVAKKIATKFKLPLHVQIHTDFVNPYFARGSLLNWIRVHIALKVLPEADAIRVVSQRIKDSLLNAARYKLQAVPVVLPIFTDLEKFTTRGALVSEMDDLQKKYSEWGFIMLMASRLTNEKNIGFAIDILRELLKKYPKVGLVVVGEGPLKASLRWKVQSGKLEDNVVFESWKSDLVPYYKTANLFLQTSLFEGFGLSLLEAVASGCPAVSSDVGIAPELLTHKGHSFVCPVNDLECFTAKISELIEDNQLRVFFSTQISPDAIAPFRKTKAEYLKAYSASLESAITQRNNASPVNNYQVK